MSKPFHPVSEILTSKHKQTFNDIYGEPENFLEIEVCSVPPHPPRSTNIR